MKTLIKIIIIVFSVGLLGVYIFIPAIGYAKEPSMPIQMPWYLVWFIVGHVTFGFALCIIPLIYIINWIDKSMNEKSILNSVMKIDKELKNQIEEGIHVK